jgi:hypothetical protein
MSAPRPRPTPFDLVFGDTVDSTFEKIRTALRGTGQDPRGRDEFLMVREVVELLHELRPAEGLGEGIDQLVALLHHSYLFWDAGCRTIEVGPERLVDLLRATPSEPQQEDPPPFYGQLPERRIWAQVVQGEAQEPLDGCFVYGSADHRTLCVLGVFGLHRDRAGFSVVEVAGERPVALIRLDGSELFSPALPGGTAAALFSVTGEEELLELGWRTRAVAIEPAVEAG